MQHLPPSCSAALGSDRERAQQRQVTLGVEELVQPVPNSGLRRLATSYAQPETALGGLCVIA